MDRFRTSVVVPNGRSTRFNDRLLDRILCGDGKDALDAAYDLVVGHWSLVPGLTRGGRPSAMDADAKDLFRARLEAVLADLGARHAYDLRATKGSRDGDLDVVVFVRSRPAFRIGGRDVRLRDRPSTSSRLRLTCANAVAPFEVDVRTADVDERRDGGVSVATAVVPVGGRPKSGRLTMTIGHDGSVRTATVTVR